MNRNQYEHGERMHRGGARERELERQRNQQFQGQYARSPRFQEQESGYSGGAYGPMDEDFDERYGHRGQHPQYASPGGGYGGMERQWQTPSHELHGGYGDYGQSTYGYGQAAPFGQSQFNQGWSEPWSQPSQYGGQSGPERWQQQQRGQGPLAQQGYPGQHGQYSQQYGQQGLYGQQGSFGQSSGSPLGQQGLYGGSGRGEGQFGQQGQYGQSQGLFGAQGQRLEGSQFGQQESFRGKGPKGYVRSDDRIKEDICERLTRHPEIDASDIEIEAKQGVITLSGSVNQRQYKHQVEDLVENVSGVKDIENRITVKASSPSSTQTGSQAGGRGQQASTTTGGQTESKPRH